MSGFAKTFKDRYAKTFKDKVKNRNNKLMSLCINNEKLLKNIKPFGLRLKTSKILNWRLYQLMVIDI